MFCRVKLGVHEETGEQVAVKIMDKSHIKAQEMTMNVRREIAIMKALKHRNIVNLRQVLTSRTKLYIVMDLVTGGELFTKILEEGKLEESIARRYFQQLVDGIEYCHKRGVCHRDLKPENLLIDETTGELKITDFGLSAMRGASTTEELLHTQCGSPNYCAPEIIARHKEGYSGSKVDAWSCGIILFALLAGFLPFFNSNTRMLYRMIQRDEVKFPKKFPPNAKELVLSLLHKEPEHRFTLGAAKKHPWFLVDYKGDDAVASPSVPRKRRGRHGRRASVDQGPNSRDLATPRTPDPVAPPVTSPSNSDTTVPNFPAPPKVPPLPPGTNFSAAGVPTCQRPPVPPPISPPPPSRPPLPPSSVLPPNALPTPTSQPLAPNHSPVRPQAPLPPPTIPHKPVVPPPLNPGLGSIRPAPPYPGNSTVRRQLHVSEVSVGTSGEQGSGGSIENGGATLPSYSSVAEATSSTHTLESSASPTKVDETTARHAGVVTSRAPVEDVEQQLTTHAETKTLDEHNKVSASKSVPITSAALDEETVSGIEPSGSSLPQGLKSKWIILESVSGASHVPTDTAFVSTPSTLADGDASWQKASILKDGEVEDSNSNTIEKAVHPKMVQQNVAVAGSVGVKLDEVESPKSEFQGREETAKPLSLVEQRLRLFNQNAADSELPLLPECSFVSSSKPAGNPPFVSKDESLTKGQRFGDRPEVPAITGYPLGHVDPSVEGEKDNSIPLIERGAEGPDVGSSVGSVSHDDGDVGDSQVPVPVGTRRIAMGGGVREGANPPLVDDDESGEAPLKQRLAAAVARYRRIFKLGNKIGITASPSFSSNKGSMIAHDDSSGEEDQKATCSSDRMDFFARAKNVTGAWGIILTQELEEESDSDDESPQITEVELKAFSRLLDFWDNRRASASVPKGEEVLLDDENTSPLSEEDILSIQSLLQKLEPKQVEDEMSEVADEASFLPKEVVATGNGSESRPEDFEDLDVEGIQIGVVEMPKKGIQMGAERTIVYEKETFRMPAVGNTQNANQSVLTAPMPIVPVPPPPPMPPRNDIRSNGVHIPPPPPPMPRSAHQRKDAFVPPSVVVSVSVSTAMDSADIGKSTAQPPHPPVACVVETPGLGVSLDTYVGTVSIPPPPPPPPAYAAPVVAKSEHSVSPRIVCSSSTLRDPYRPPAFPTFHEMQSGPRVNTHGNETATTNPSHVPRKKKSGSSGGLGVKRRSSSNAAEIEDKKKTSGDSGRVVPGASEGSRVDAPPRRGHIRSPSRDENATRGLFAFGIFNRRKSSSITHFESDLSPERCLVELGRILSKKMGCKVLMKRGESKMKCEAPLNQGKMFISITCTQEKKTSTVYFRKGKKDRSQVDAKEFLEFFETVKSRFFEHVGPETRGGP